MRQLVEFPVSDESAHVVLVEVDEGALDSGVEQASRGDDVGKAAATIAQSVDSVWPAAEAVLKTLRGHVHGPDEVTLTFGVKLSGGVNAIIAAATGEANFQVQMKWARAPEDPAPDGVN
jgi:hypothetical protein